VRFTGFYYFYQNLLLTVNRYPFTIFCLQLLFTVLLDPVTPIAFITKSERSLEKKFEFSHLFFDFSDDKITTKTVNQCLHLPARTHSQG